MSLMEIIAVNTLDSRMEQRSYIMYLMYDSVKKFVVLFFCTFICVTLCPECDQNPAHCSCSSLDIFLVLIPASLTPLLLLKFLPTLYLLVITDVNCTLPVFPIGPIIANIRHCPKSY